MCERIQLRWLKVAYLRELLRIDEGNLVRCQDLPGAAYVAGDPRKQAVTAPRLFVVSHAWASQAHPSPTGAKLGNLVAALGRLGAVDTDVVFLDFCNVMCHIIQCSRFAINAEFET